MLNTGQHIISGLDSHIYLHLHGYLIISASSNPFGKSATLILLVSTQQYTVDPVLQNHAMDVMIHAFSTSGIAEGLWSN
jgi:hypothetical protein